MLEGGHFAVEPPGQKGNTRVGFIREVAPQLHNQYLAGYPGADGLRLYRCGTKPDGSCFFHAVCAALNVKDWHGNKTSENTRTRIGHELREVVDTVLTTDSWMSFWRKKLAADDLVHRIGEVPSAASISTRLRNITDWADVWLISWAMRQLDISCVFFDEVAGSRMYCGVRGEPDARTHIMICWVDHAHFEPVFLHNTHTGKMQTSFTHGDPFMKHILTIYNQQQCPGAKIAI